MWEKKERHLEENITIGGRRDGSFIFYGWSQI